MTYIATDRVGGFPVELFTFSTSSNFWRYTSADAEKVVNLLTYTPIPIERPRIKTAKELSRNSLTVKVDINAEFLDLYRGAPPSEPVSFLLQSYHENDPDLELVTLWRGKIASVKFGERVASVVCESVAASTRQQVITRNYQTSCPYVLYGNLCAVTSASFRTTTTVSAINGSALTLTGLSQPDGYFAGGYIEWNNGSLFETRFIVSQIGLVVNLDLPFIGIPGGATVRVYPGCDHTIQTCNDKFSNTINYGGQPYYPERNPMSGSENVF